MRGIKIKRLYRVNVRTGDGFNIKFETSRLYLVLGAARVFRAYAVVRQAREAIPLCGFVQNGGLAPTVSKIKKERSKC